MKIRVLFFAQARVLAGVSLIELSVSEGACLREVQQQILLQYPPLTGIAEQLLWAVNGEYSDGSRLLVANCEIACFPPVSGG